MVKIAKCDLSRVLAGENIGIRFDRCKTMRRIGSPLPCSYDWSQEEYTGKRRIRLDGTCAVDVINDSDSYRYNDLAAAEEAVSRAIDRVYDHKYNCYNYSYNHIYLIAGTDSMGGDDDNEIIISNAEVVGVIDVSGHTPAPAEEFSHTPHLQIPPVNQAALSLNAQIR